ncbi:aldehyde dehydrogenase [Microbacterium sp. No. 7]|uniref:aldehyde dehydrogenase n=1 Tax=Microbacterium sp. No. 7 TaxID=1714373 RepID=UPI000A538532|nr:aldehyde dehydrogenase [Microbacterium sp. No. 7]
MTEGLYIGGRWVEPLSTARIDVISPYTEQVIGTVPDASREDVDRAVAAAREAFDRGPWPRLTLDERIAAMKRFTAHLAEREAEIALAVTEEMGCPITLSKTMQAMGPRLMLDAFIDAAPQVQWSQVRPGAMGTSLITREPVGVVAAVVPWNAPLLVASLKLGPALLSGCTVVLKTSPETPLSARFYADAAEAAGLPAGVLNIVSADRESSEYLISHRGVDKVSFTGSTAAGRRIAEVCGRDLRRVTLELGGKSAAVVLDDADFDIVLPQIRALSLRNSGQVCSNKTRIVVPRSRKKELVDRVVDMLESLHVGDPKDAVTDIGPLVAQRQRTMVERYIGVGRDEGARLVTGGGRPADLEHGWFVQPTLFTDVTPDMTIAREEIFGPVLSVLEYDTVDEAIDIANATDYGLSGSVFASDVGRALEVARGMRTGTVELNGNVVGFQSPVGGFKTSGIGREAGVEGFEAYVEIKSYGIGADYAARLSAP